MLCWSAFAELGGVGGGRLDGPRDHGSQKGSDKQRNVMAMVLKVAVVWDVEEITNTDTSAGAPLARMM